MAKAAEERNKKVSYKWKKGLREKLTVCVVFFFPFDSRELIEVLLKVVNCRWL